MAARTERSAEGAKSKCPHNAEFPGFRLREASLRTAHPEPAEGLNTNGFTIYGHVPGRHNGRDANAAATESFANDIRRGLGNRMLLKPSGSTLVPGRVHSQGSWTVPPRKIVLVVDRNTEIIQYTTHPATGFVRESTRPF